MMQQKSIFTVFAATLLYGCSFLASSVTYYDPTTYKNLTDLKPEVVFLYETFAQDSIDLSAIQQVRLTMARILEYEKGKGDKNRETTAQIRIIRGIFEGDVEHRNKNGKWSNAQRDNQIENISDAFDLAISTERLKNKNE